MKTREKKNKEKTNPEKEWEDAYLGTNEKLHIETLLKDMQLPSFDTDFDEKTLISVCLSICLGLKFKLPKWERFLLDSEK